LNEPAIPDSVLTANVHEDDDSWLYINPNQLDSMLDDKFNNAQVRHAVVYKNIAQCIHNHDNNLNRPQLTRMKIMMP